MQVFYTIYPAFTSCGQEYAFNISLDVECMAESLYRNCWKNTSIVLAVLVLYVHIDHDVKSMYHKENGGTLGIGGPLIFNPNIYTLYI